VFERAGLLFAFNFHPQNSYPDYQFEAPAGKYHMVFQSDALEYGGHHRLGPEQKHATLTGSVKGDARTFLSLYLPCRTALVLQRVQVD
jgi:1,4-alpha-glucan branching enzyme